MINIAATVSDPSLTGTHYEGHWVSDATRDELVECFDSFEPDVRALVKVSSLHTEQTGFVQTHMMQLCQKPSKWALHVVKPLPFCVRNRVALIGDSVRLSQGWGLQARFRVVDERSNPLVSRHGALHGCRCGSSD